MGPWAGGSTPRAQRRIETLSSGGREMRVAIYEDEDARRPPTGGYLIAPGLHYAGRDDLRMDRFCRVLAASGLLVMAPFLPDFLDLCISSRSADDLAVAWDRLEQETRARSLPPPALFSISFGSCPAIELAARG